MAAWFAKLFIIKKKGLVCVPEVLILKMLLFFSWLLKIYGFLLFKIALWKDSTVRKRDETVKEQLEAMRSLFERLIAIIVKLSRARIILVPIALLG